MPFANFCVAGFSPPSPPRTVVRVLEGEEHPSVRAGGRTFESFGSPLSFAWCLGAGAGVIVYSRVVRWLAGFLALVLLS